MSLDTTLAQAEENVKRLNDALAKYPEARRFSDLRKIWVREYDKRKAIESKLAAVIEKERQLWAVMTEAKSALPPEAREAFGYAEKKS